MSKDIKIKVENPNVQVETGTTPSLKINAVSPLSQVTESFENTTQIAVSTEKIEIKEKKSPVILEINTSGFFPPTSIPDPKISVKKDNVLIGTQGTINFITGSNVVLTTSNDTLNNTINITIAATNQVSSQPQNNNGYFPQGWS